MLLARKKVAAANRAVNYGVMRYSHKNGIGVQDVTKAINRSVYTWASRTKRFATWCAITVNPATHDLVACNAAFSTGFIWGNGKKITDLCGPQESTPPLGLREDLTARVQTTTLMPGEAVVLATDGLVAAKNTTGAEYGMSRLHAVLCRGWSDADDLGVRIEDDLIDHCTGATMSDDVVILCITRDRITYQRKSAAGV